MTQQTGGPSGAPRIIDTRGDTNFTPIYAGVVVIEAIVVAALWIFSRYYS